MKATLLHLLLALLLLGLLGADGKLYCFRRLKRSNKCSGLLRKHTYTTSEECCSRRGQGFADNRVKLGKNRFRCTGCPPRLPRLSQPRLPNLLTSLHHLTPRPSPQPSSTVTPDFTWPTPAPRHEFAYPDPRYPPGAAVQWEPWAPCSVTCGAGWRSRARVCAQCDRNDYENVQSQPCMINFYCPVDGNWGSWTPWAQCTSTCGSGTRVRNRKCNYPPPAYGGATCEGESVASKSCDLEPCPVDGSWSPWSTFSSCSVTCGRGMMTRGRGCDSPRPQHGGAECPGPDSHQEECMHTNCPVHGGWASWTSWTFCSVTCGSGMVERSRSCSDPRPQFGGHKCRGPGSEQHQCHSQVGCPVAGGWSEWGDYGVCRSPRCGRGYKTRSRLCDSPRPQHGGQGCLGVRHERLACRGAIGCHPEAGHWCGWGHWGDCSTTCGETQPWQARHRDCACPRPRNGGPHCRGKNLQVRTCRNVKRCDTFEETEAASGDNGIDDEETSTEESIPRKPDGFTSKVVSHRTDTEKEDVAYSVINTYSHHDQNKPKFTIRIIKNGTSFYP